MYRESDSSDAEEPPAALKIRIKNVLENQRSVLEYLANGIFADYGDGSDAQVYYPVADRSEQFDGLFDRHLPGVADRCPEVRDAIEARQGYQKGYEWLTHLVRLTNENKHLRLARQMRVEMPVMQIVGKDGKPMNVHGAVYVAETTTEVKDLGFQRDWFFKDPPVPARVTLTKIQASLPGLIDGVLAVLP